jgi:hypothetical protein
MNLVGVFSEPLKQLTQRPVEGFCYTFAKPSLILRHLRNHTPSSSEDRVKCSLFHLAAYTYEVNQAGLSAQLFPGSIITGLRMADNKRGEGT